MERCLGCMELAADHGKCPKCGFDVKNYSINPRCLRLNTTLNNRYVVGKVLGEGGFGITYIGWDAVLDLPVAIKEYFPANVALRDTTNGSEIYVYEGKAGEAYQEGLKRCIKEVKSLSKFHDLTGVVSIHDFFYANGTAYIIMEYLRGITLKEYVKKHGKIRPDQVFQLMKPVMRSLAGMHQTGMIHRDISPDNIMVTIDGKIKLIDFGAARISNVDEKSFTIFLKRGYTPEEQYRSNGQQGPWTDVYAVSGTMYYMITGETPPESLERAMEDTLQSFEQLGIQFPKRQQDALMKGLSVFYKNRYQSIAELYREIYGENLEFLSNTTIGEGNDSSVDIDKVLRTESTITQNQQEIEQVLKENKGGVTGQPAEEEKSETAKQTAEEKAGVPLEAADKGKKKWVIAIASVAAVLFITVVVLLVQGGKKGGSGDEAAIQANATQKTAAEKTKEPEPTDAPAKEFKMIGVKGKEEFAAKEAINALGDEQLKTTVKYAYNEKVKKGRVINQSIAADSSYVQGEKSEIVLTVSKGPKMITVPDLLGKSKGSAIKLLRKKGLKYKIKGYEHSSGFSKGEVMGQSVSSGKQVRKNKVVELVISLGEKKVVITTTPQPQRSTPVPNRVPSPTRRPTPTKRPAPAKKPTPTKKPNPTRRPDPFS